MDSQGGSLGEIKDNGESASQQVAGSNGKTHNKQEKCNVCKRTFKGARGVRIHQGKSGCKSALGQNRIVKSKPVVGEIQESHHRDFSCASKPEKAANTSSTGGPDTHSEVKSSSTTDITLSQEITCKLREIRKESEILIIDDDTEEGIQQSILEAEERFIESAEESDDFIEIIKEMDEGDHIDVPGIPEERREVRKGEENLVYEILESDEEVIGIEDIERIEEFTKIVKVCESPKVLQKVNARRQNTKRYQAALPSDQNNLRQWVKEDRTKRTTIKWKDVFRFFCNGDLNEEISTGTFTLRRIDYKSLVGKNYLNDLVIEEYLDIIKERNATAGLPILGVMSVYLYPQFELLSFEDALIYTERWNKNDLRQCEIILCPIHKNDHWSLVSIDNKAGIIEYYDSIIGNRKASNAPRIMKRYMEEYYKRWGEKKVFKIKVREDAPIQENGVDCGVFVCQNSEKIARKAYVNTRQDDMARARKQMMVELYHRKLMTPDEASPDKLKDLVKDAFPAVEKVQDKFKKCTTSTGKGTLEPSRKFSKPAKAIKRYEMMNRKNTPKEKMSKCKPDEIQRKVQNVINTSKDQHSKEEMSTSAPTNKREVKIQDSGKRKQEIKWPKSNSPEWEKFDDDASKRLRIIMASSDILAEVHPKVIYNMGFERFGVSEKKSPKTRGPSRRQKCMSNLRREIKKLDKAVKSAPEEEKDGIKQLHKEKLRDLRLKKRAENVRKNRQKFRKNCSEFLSQPYDFSRRLINPRPQGQLKSTKQEVEAHLHKVHSNPVREEEQEVPEEMWEHDEPKIAFNNNPPTFAEFTKKLRKTRTKSAPGPNGVPYKVYKRCPEVSKLLYQYLRSLWAKNSISDTWREAEGVFIPKEENASSVEKFRTISLLNVEGKLFFSLKSERIIDYVLANGYIDTSIQKGGVPGVSGCLEHTSVISQLIREAKKEKKNLVVTWLDIANAYGSIPHKVIMRALDEAHIPKEVIQMVESYYSEARIRFATRNFTTDWQKVEKGIITGCTLSVVLFSLAMTWIVMSVKHETKGPKLSSGNLQVNSRLLMDDITTTTETMVQTSYLLDKLIRKLHWAGLYEKVEKCRALVIIKGVVSCRKLEINGKPIQSIQDAPVKFLGKWYNANLNEKDQIGEIMKGVKKDIQKVEKCRLPGRYKAWMVQHMLMPRLMWPLSIYNVPMSTVEAIQRLITQALKRWLGLPKTLSTACFYSKTAKLQFPYSELTEEVKAAKARNLVTLTGSKDSCISGANIVVDGGFKANTPQEVEEATSNLRMKDITGTGNVGLEGLGMRKSQYFYKASGKEQRDMIVKEIRKKEEDRRMVKMVEQGKQGAMTRWEVPEHRLSHKELLGTTETRIKFLTKAVYDLLPTPANKSKWYGEEDTCNLCQERGTLNHILTGCRTALSQGRYTWRHNKVLQEIYKRINKKASQQRQSSPNRRE